MQPTPTTTWPSFREWQQTRLPEPYRNICRVRWALRDMLARRAAHARLQRQIGEALLPTFVTLTAATEKATAAFRSLAAAGSPAAKFAQAHANAVRLAGMSAADVRVLRRDMRNMGRR